MSIAETVKEKNGVMVQLVTFTIDNEEYAVNIADVIEIIRLPKVQPLPKSPDFMKGIINLRGTVVPIVDIRTRFNLQSVNDNALKRTIIVKVDEQKIGMIVDSVSKVIRINSDEIKEPPQFTSVIGSEYIEGVIMLQERMIILLNVNRIFSKEEIRDLSRASEHINHENG